MTLAAPEQPDHNCPLCPRLAEFRAENRRKFPSWFNAPVPSFGPLDARLLIVGLAPGLQGANRTGRPFTGDWAGELLYATLLKHKFAKGHYQARSDDDLALIDCRIANAVRCVPPQNKPEPREIRTCRPFLRSELDNLAKLEVILALGKIAHDSLCEVLGVRKALHPFKHGASHHTQRFKLISSYHCSRYNTNTGVLSAEMFDDIIARARALLSP